MALTMNCLDNYFCRCNTKVVALNIRANNVVAFTTTSNNTNTHGNKKSKFLEMEEQEHQVLHTYKPKPYNNTAAAAAADMKTSNEDDQQLKKHLSALSCDSLASSEPSLIDMHDDEAARFIRSMQILFNRRVMMEEQLGYHPTRHFSQDRTSLQPMVNGVPPVILAADQMSPQRMFAAPNRSTHVDDVPLGMMEQNHCQQQHSLTLPHSNDSNAWNDDAPSIMAYSESPFTSQRSNRTVSGHHSSIESLGMFEQL